MKRRPPKILNTPGWRLAVHVARGVAGRGWRRYLAKLVGPHCRARGAFDVKSDIRGAGNEEFLRRAVNDEIRRHDAAAAVRRAELVALHHAIDVRAAERVFVRDQPARMALEPSWGEIWTLAGIGDEMRLRCPEEFENEKEPV